MPTTKDDVLNAMDGVLKRMRIEKDGLGDPLDFDDSLERAEFFIMLEEELPGYSYDREVDDPDKFVTPNQIADHVLNTVLANEK